MTRAFHLTIDAVDNEAPFRVHVAFEKGIDIRSPRSWIAILSEIHLCTKTKREWLNEIIESLKNADMPREFMQIYYLLCRI